MRAATRITAAFTFGTGKVGDLAGFASALVLAIIAIGIAVESVQRLFNPSTVAFGEATVIAVIGLIVNIASAFLLSGGASSRRVTMTTTITTARIIATTICAPPSCMCWPMR